MIQVTVNPKSRASLGMLWAAIKGLKAGPYRVTIEPGGEPRTSAQNRCFHLLLDKQSQFTGEAIGDIKRRLVEECLGPEFVELKDGTLAAMEIETRHLSKYWFSKLIDHLDQQNAELGIR